MFIYRRNNLFYTLSHTRTLTLTLLLLLLLPAVEWRCTAVDKRSAILKCGGTAARHCVSDLQL